MTSHGIERLARANRALRRSALAAWMLATLATSSRLPVAFTSDAVRWYIFSSGMLLTGWLLERFFVRLSVPLSAASSFVPSGAHSGLTLITLGRLEGAVLIQALGVAVTMWTGVQALALTATYRAVLLERSAGLEQHTGGTHG
jgi:hypothetical protein